MNKSLLFVSNVYSLSELLNDGFIENNWSAKIVDYREIIPHSINRFCEKTSGLPQKLTRYWKPAYYNLINKRYTEIFNKEKPDIVFVYNNQFVFPETIRHFKKEAKIVFFLGDNPLWSKTFDHNLTILKQADLVLSPDSHWQFELSMLGIPNVICDYIGYSKKRFYKTDNIPKKIREKYDSDLLFIGRNYRGSSGYKRSLFLNSFAGLNFKLFGKKEWKPWLDQFPDLQPHFNPLSSRISHEELNQAINCTKIYPIDQNTGITNGIHLRVFETIGAGALPLVEWRKDIDDVFNGLLPVIRSYDEAKEVANQHLKSETLRLDTLNALQEHVEKTYTPEKYIRRILSRLEMLSV